MDEYEAAEFQKRVLPFDSGPLDDEETASAAEQLFAWLDGDETADENGR
jgi:hypothetical protein